MLESSCRDKRLRSLELARANPVKAMAAAPNPGYPVAIEGCKAVVVLLGSWLLFNSGMSATKVAGMVLCLVGVLLVTR